MISSFSQSSTEISESFFDLCSFPQTYELRCPSFDLEKIMMIHDG
jgi:hypothetical protein